MFAYPIPEITNLINEIKKSIIYISSISYTDITNKSESNSPINPQNSSDFTKTIRVKNKVTFTILEEISQSISVFKLVEFLISKDLIFKNHTNFIFQKGFKIYKNQAELTLDEIGEMLDITKERTRQIRKECLSNIFNSFHFVKQIDGDWDKKYNIGENQQLIFLDEDFNNHINEISNTNFSREFNTFIIYTYFSDKFNLIGNIEDALLFKFSNSSQRYNWANLYIVEKQLSQFFDFNKFANDVYGRLNDRIEETYSFEFSSYVNNFIKNNDTSIAPLIVPIAEKIINKEFALSVDINNNIIFKSNIAKPLHKYAYEALEILGNPSHISDINRQVKILYPDFKKNISNNNLKKEFGFDTFGRQSTFGLTKWVFENESIKSGTIRDIAEQFLSECSEPMKIKDVAEYVLKYRPESNTKSIENNLKLDSSNRFIFFNNQFLGLNNIDYNS